MILMCCYTKLEKNEKTYAIQKFKIKSKKIYVTANF